MGLQTSSAYKRQRIILHLLPSHGHGTKRVCGRLFQAGELQSLLSKVRKLFAVASPEAPGQAQRRFPQLFPDRRFFHGRPCEALRERILPLHLAGLRRKERPLILPLNGHNEGLSAQVLADAADQAGGKKYGIPLPALRPDQIGVAGVLDRRFFAHVTDRKDGIGGIALIGPQRSAASCHRGAVIHLRAALRDQQIVPVADVIDMRRFGRRDARHGASPEGDGLGDQAEVFNVILGRPDSLAHSALAVRPDIGGSHDVAFAVVVKKERGVNPRHIVEEVRGRPGTGRILRRDDEVAAVAEIAVYDVEGPLVIADRGGHNAAVSRILVHIETVLRREHIGDLLPVSQIFAVKERKAGAQLEAGADQIIVVARSADGRVRIETGDDRILNFLFHTIFLLVSVILPSHVFRI